MERVRFIDHQGIRILYLDFSHGKVREILETIDKAAGVIRSTPGKTLLTLTHTTGAHFDSQVIKAMKEFAKGNEPHVRAAAIVGVTGLQKIVLDATSLFSKREFAVFNDLEGAKDYLSRHA